MERQRQWSRESCPPLGPGQHREGEGKRSASGYGLVGRPIQFLFTERWEQLSSTPVFWSQESLRPG